MPQGGRLASAQALGPNPRLREEPLINGRQDVRRASPVELAWWQQAIGHRDEYPANIWFCGDSYTENFGVTDDYHAWTDLVRQALQNRYRNGGIGYIPGRHSPGFTWPYATNPDGKNTWAFTSGAFLDSNDYGFSLGRRGATLGANAVYQITVDCDRFWIAYTTYAATITIDVDPGTPFAQTTTVNMTGAPTLSSRIFDSFTAWGTLILGTHVVRITAPAGGAFIDGLNVFYTDANVGVHTYNGGHSGYWATHFNSSSTVASYWADLAYQPSSPVSFTDGVGNGTTTFTSATATFTDLDIGSYIVFEGGTRCTNGMARIVARGSGTSVTLDRTVVTATGIGFQMNRAQFTDAAITSASKTMTSATAAFNPWDVGMYLATTASIPAGTYIARYDSPTQVQLSQNATATQTAQTVRVLGRQARWCAPDLIFWEFGTNDFAGGSNATTFKSDTRAGIALAAERAAIGFPVGYPQRYNPSVVVLGAWAAGWLSNYAAVDVQTTNLLPTIISDAFDFDPADAGKSITSPSNTPIQAGTTIASVQSNRQATLSLLAVATNAAGTATITSRQLQEKHWQKARIAMAELCAEKLWRFFDLYSLGGYIGPNDVYNLTYDLGHANNHGAKWWADELDIVLTGQPRNGPIPQGIFDAKGDVIVGAAADLAGKLPAGQDGQALVWANGAPLGALQMDPSSAASLGQLIPSSAGAGAYLADGLVPPSSSGTVSTVDDAEAKWVNHATSTTQFNAAQLSTATFAVTRSQRLPEFAAYVKLDPTVNTSVMYCVGLCSGTMATLTPGNSPAAAIQGAYFRYNTIDDTAGAYWRCVTSDGTTRKISTTSVLTGPGSSYRLRVVCRGVRGVSLAAVDFYINDVLVATHTVNLPASGTDLGAQALVEALATLAARNIKVARLSVSGP